MDQNILKDKRFSHVVSNPRFKSIPRKDRKVKIDKRFQSMFTDKRFQVKYKVDERGRQINELQSENYKKYYDISDSSEESDSENESEKDSDAEEKVLSGEEAEQKNKLSLKGNEIIESEDKLSGSESKEHTKPLVKENEESDGKLNEEEAEKQDSADENHEAESTGDKNKLKEKLKEVNKYIDEIHKSKKLNEKVRGKLTDITTDYARGIGTLLSGSESSSDEPSSDDESDYDTIEHPWGELDKDAEETEEISRRLAVCNMDWDRVTAKDLMVLFHSFLPSDGFIESVTIYPSEFGLERMAEEELKGPKELTEGKENPDSDEEIEEGSEYQREKLREYQLKRLKYYYAVVVCNSEQTANTLYTECDGIEYESSAMKLDLRFIGDDITFDQKPHDVCTSLPDLKKYKPRLFINTALQQGKVDLTWDETDPNRIDFTRKILAGEEVDENEVKAFLASSSSEDEGNNPEQAVESDDDIKDDKERILKYRALMSSLQEENDKKKGDVEMEVTWGPDSSKDHKDLGDESGSENEADSSKEVEMSSNDGSDDGISKKSGKKSKTKKIQKERGVEDVDGELELLLADDDPEESGKKHFSLKAIQKEEKEKSKKKWKKKLKKKTDYQEEDTFKIDTTDNRFSALFTSHHFNIDPADPHFRKTKAMNELITEKQKRRKLES